MRVAIGMWVTQALIGPLYLALPGVDGRHAGVVYACSLFALLWAVMNALIPSDPRLAFLFPLGGVLALTDVSVLVASTGGAGSPLRASQLFFVVFAAWFMPRKIGVAVLTGAVVLTLMPLAYDGNALAGPSLGWTIMLILTFVVVGTTIIAARGKLERLRDRARAESLRDPLDGPRQPACSGGSLSPLHRGTPRERPPWVTADRSGSLQEGQHSTWARRW